MMFNKVHTLYAMEEMTKDGHAPVLFHCSDGDNYYCKYRVNINRKEINCLAYEVIAHRLLRKLDIPTPEIALVKLASGTLDEKIIKIDRRMKEGTVVFGSKRKECFYSCFV